MAEGDKNNKATLKPQRPGAGGGKTILKDSVTTDVASQSEVIRFDSGGQMPPGKVVHESTNTITMKNTKSK